MSKSKIWIKIIAVPLLIAFFAQDLAFAQGGIAEISVPKNLVSSQESYKAPLRNTHDAVRNTIINIQDAHASLGAQESIVSILDSLVTNYDLKLVAIEGSSGYIDTSLLRTFPDHNIRDKAAKDLMASGLMSAAEFFSVTSDKGIALYGVEDRAVYKENLEEFRAVYEMNRSVKDEIEYLGSAVKRLKEKVYSRQLLEIEEISLSGKSGARPFKDRWLLMKELASKAGIDRGIYRNLDIFVRSTELEKGISFEKANRERDLLIEELSKKFEKKDIGELLLKCVEFKTGKISQGDYYLFLKNCLIRSGMDMAPYRELLSYTEYIGLYESIDILSLFEEEKAFEDSIRAKLFKDEYQRKLYDISQYLDLIKGLFELKLTSEDFDKLQSFIDSIGGLEKAIDFIKEASREYKIEERPDYNLERIVESIPAALKFYRTARKRNAAMLENTIKKMKSEGTNVAALITGGYHTKGLTGLFKDNDTSYIVILPKFDSSKGERPYITILTNKKAPYEHLLKGGQYYLMTAAYFDADPSIPESERFAGYKSRIIGILDEAVSGIKADSPRDEKRRSIIEAWSSSYRAFYADAKRSPGFQPRSPEQIDEFLYSLISPAGAKKSAGKLFPAESMLEDIRDREDLLRKEVVFEAGSVLDQKIPRYEGIIIYDNSRVNIKPGSSKQAAEFAQLIKIALIDVSRIMPQRGPPLPIHILPHVHSNVQKIIHRGKSHLILDENYITTLLKYRSIYPKAIPWILAERLVHEFTHNDTMGTSAEEAMEERDVIINSDLRFFRLLCADPGLKGEVDGFFDATGVTFHGARYFKRLLLRIKDSSPEETRREVEEFVDRCYNFDFKFGKSFPSGDDAEKSILAGDEGLSPLKYPNPHTSGLQLDDYDRANYKWDAENGYWYREIAQGRRLVLGTWEDVKQSTREGAAPTDMENHVVIRMSAGYSIYVFDDHSYSPAYLNESIERREVYPSGNNQIFIDDHPDTFIGVPGGDVALTLASKLKYHAWVYFESGIRWMRAETKYKPNLKLKINNDQCHSSRYFELESRPKKGDKAIINIDTDAAESEIIAGFLADVSVNDGVTPSAVHISTSPPNVTGRESYGDTSDGLAYPEGFGTVARCRDLARDIPRIFTHAASDKGHEITVKNIKIGDTELAVVEHELIRTEHVKPQQIIVPDNGRKLKDAELLGERALTEGRVGLITVAGGMASRAGIDYPKGMYSIMPVSGKTLFEARAEELKAHSARYGKVIPWYIMTSPLNDDLTRGYFEENYYFGLGKENVIFVRQEEVPAVESGTQNAAKKDDDTVLKTPNGHGGIYTAMRDANLRTDGGRKSAVEDAKRRGVDTLLYCQVDNPMPVVNKIALGYHLMERSDFTTIAVMKRDPKEGLAMLAIDSTSGKPFFVEYNQPAAATLREIKGYEYGGIGRFILSRDFISNTDLPSYRLIRDKKAKILKYGELIDGLVDKFECLVFDSQAQAGRYANVYVDRAECFAPFKAMEGEDTPAAAAGAISELCKIWFIESGRAAEVSKESVIEVSPAYALSPLDIKAKTGKGLRIKGGSTVYLGGADIKIGSNVIVNGRLRVDFEDPYDGSFEIPDNAIIENTDVYIRKGEKSFPAGGDWAPVAGLDEKVLVNLDTGRIKYGVQDAVVKNNFDLFFVRHGQTKGNLIDGFFQGDSDEETNQLIESGRDGAKKAAEQLFARLESRIRSGEEIVVVTSKLGRTKETAGYFVDLVRERTGKVLIVIEEELVNERSFGIWENKASFELPAGERELVDRYRNGLDATVRPRNGESYIDLLLRARKSVEKFNDRYHGKTVVLFGHATHISSVRTVLGDKRLNDESGQINWRSTMLPNAGILFVPRAGASEEKANPAHYMKKTWQIFLGSSAGFTLGLIYWYCFKYALIDATLAAIIASIQPLATYLLASKLVKSEKAHRLKFIAIILATAGILIFSVSKSAGAYLHIGPDAGFALSIGIILMAILYAGFTIQSVYSNKAQKEYGVKPVVLTLIGFASGVVIGLAAQVIRAPELALQPLTLFRHLLGPLISADLLFFLYIANDVLKWNLQNYALHKLDASRVQTGLTLVPVVTFILAFSSAINGLGTAGFIVMAAAGMIMVVGSNIWLANINRPRDLAKKTPFRYKAALGLLILVKALGTIIGIKFITGANDWSIIQVYFSTHLVSFAAMLSLAAITGSVKKFYKPKALKSYIIGLPEGSVTPLERPAIAREIDRIFNGSAEIYVMTSSDPGELIAEANRRGIKYGAILDIGSDPDIQKATAHLQALADKAFRDAHADIAIINASNIDLMTIDDLAVKVTEIERLLPAPAPASIENLKTDLQRRARVIGSSFAHVNSASLDTLLKNRDNAVSITTQGVIESGMLYTLRDKILARWQKMNISDKKDDPVKEVVAITDPKIKDDASARRYISALGLEGYVDHVFARTAGEVNSLSSLYSGTAGHIGLRARKGDIKDYESLRSSVPSLIILELGDINGIFVDTNSYEALFELFAVGETVYIPGVSKDEARRIFIYIPKAVPIDYDKEVREHQRALKAILSAA